LHIFPVSSSFLLAPFQDKDLMTMTITITTNA
jgi:hypothetical protein